MLTIPKRDAFEKFLGYCAPYVGDLATLRLEANEVEVTMKAGRTTARNAALEKRWYASIVRGTPDYSVYDDDDYLAELWGCWNTYAKAYLRLITGLNIRPTRVVDLGCGIGFSTAALRQMYPACDVTGTNVKDTIQWKIAEDVGREYGFSMQASATDKGGLFFASEYFEHFERPVEHLMEILEHEPEILVAASTFTQPSIGHFPMYEVGGRMLDGRQTGVYFGAAMKKRGYAKIRAGFWNDRPQVWVR